MLDNQFVHTFYRKTSIERPKAEFVLILSLIICYFVKIGIK